MSAENKICPHCGSDMFMATITRGGVIKVLASVDENANDEIQIIKEIQEKADIAVVKCARCRNQITQQDLIVGIKCKTCQNETNPVDIDANGNCSVCAALAERAELQSASKEDLIRMLIEAEKKASSVAARIENKQELAKQTDEATDVATKPAEEDKETKEAPAEEPTKKTRKRKNAKTVTEEPSPAEEATEEAADKETEETTEEVTNEMIENEVDNIANQQQAPFPDITQEQTAPVESNKLEDVLPGFSNPVPPEEKFEMFDDTDDVI